MKEKRRLNCDCVRLLYHEAAAQYIAYYRQPQAQLWRHVTTQSSTLIIEVGGTFVVKEFVVVFFLDILCFCVLRFCRRPPRPIIIIASSILYQQRLGISQIPATFHQIPVKCSS